MERGNLEIILKEISDELEKSNKIISQQKEEISQLREEVATFKQKLDEKKLIAPPVDTKLMHAEIVTGIARIKQVVSEQPKSVCHEKRYLFFPEYNAREYFRVFFRLILWLTVAISCIILISSVRQVIDNHKQIKLRQLEADHYKNAWEYMYRRASKQDKKRMDTVWLRSRHEDQ